MAVWYWIGILRLALLLHLDEGAAFHITGQIYEERNISRNSSLEKLRPTPVRPREEIIFQFLLEMVGYESVASTEIIINGSRLQFPAKNMRSIQFKTQFGSMNSSHMSQLMKSGHIPKMNSSVKVLPNRKSALVVVENNGLPLKTISGMFRMTVAQDSDTDEAVRSYMYIKSRSLFGDDEYSQKVFSAAFSVPVPNFDIGECVPRKIKMRGQVNLKVNITLPPGILVNSYSVLYLPTNEDKEAKMTISGYEVTDAKGLPQLTVSRLKMLSSEKKSLTTTSETSHAVLRFPEIRSDKQSGVVLNMTARLQDFLGFSDGLLLKIHVSFKVNENAIWVGRSIAFIDDDNQTAVAKVADLETSFTENQRYLDRNRMLLRLRFSVSHTLLSSATAYNVTFILYMSPSLSFVKTSKKLVDIVKPFNFEEGLGGMIRFEMPRVSFEHLTKVYFNVTVSNISGLEERPTLTYEVIYHEWRDPGEVKSLDLRYLLIDLPQKQERVWNVTLSCPCNFDPSLRNCACCKPGDCFCGKIRPDRCTACDETWKCRPILPEFFKTSTLVDDFGTRIVCDNRENKMTKRPFKSCFAENMMGEFYVLSTTVAGILGVDSETDFLYGIGNTGLGYVRSVDNGTTWHTMSQEYFKQMTTNTGFRHATFQ